MNTKLTSKGGCKLKHTIKWLLAYLLHKPQTSYKSVNKIS